MEAIYVISTLEKAKLNEYKIGRHKGSPKKLLSRYSTPLINPIIYFFIPIIDSKNIESKIKKNLDEHRIVNDNNNKTEWVNLELFNIINHINTIISQYHLITTVNNNNNKSSKTKCKPKNTKKIIIDLKDEQESEEEYDPEEEEDTIRYDKPGSYHPYHQFHSKELKKLKKLKPGLAFNEYHRLSDIEWKKYITKNEESQKQTKESLNNLSHSHLSSICKCLNVPYNGSKNKMISKIVGYTGFSMNEIKNKMGDKKYVFKCEAGHLNYSNKKMHDYFKKCQNSGKNSEAYYKCKKCYENVHFFQLDNPFF